jgi:MoaA/NifB/PqqE/SkfB family radical SAM enzyme
MRLEEIMKYVENKCKKFDKLMIIGGEPFVHDGLAEFLSQQSFSIYTIVYTNFAVPLEKHQWPDNIHFITSWDAPDEETYRQIRRTKDFPLVMRNISQNKDKIIHVDTTVSRLNIMKLDRILEMTEEIGCTHWFLPIDPRVLRYAKNHPENLLAQITAKKLRNILLDLSDLKIIREFFERHKNNSRINDYSMFEGIYLTGIRHFQDISEYSGKIEISKINVPSKIEHCSAVENYLEITFDYSGKIVPILHCPILRKKYSDDEIPHFNNFESLIDWISAIRAQIKCKSFCGRTQFLGMDSYKDKFSDVKKCDEDR